MVLNGLPAYILRVGAAEVMPPPPPAYFNDFAGIVPQNVASALNSQLANFERLTSDQILVVIYPSMQSDSSVEDYTLRVARSWKAGQKARDNGAVLFVFVQNHKMFIEVGYGLEGVLPDALCKRIIDLDIVPQFKRGDFSSGLTSGVKAILAAIQGEYKGTGQTVAESRHDFGGANQNFMPIIPPLVFFGIFILINLTVSKARKTVYIGPRGRRYVPLGNTWTNGWLAGEIGGTLWSGGGGQFGGGGGSFGGGGGGGGGDSQFSGGGGNFGGGGAGGSW